VNSKGWHQYSTGARRAPHEEIAMNTTPTNTTPTPAQTLTVLGATGAVGTLVTREALRRGHRVTAFVRDAARLAPDVAAHPYVTVVVGEIDDPRAIARAVAGSRAVVSTVGVRYRKRHPWGGIAGRPDVVPATVRTLLEALHDNAGETPLVVLLSAFGAGESWQQLPGIARVIISSSALKTSYAGLTRAEELLAASTVPHIVVRSVTMTDGPATGRPVDATGELLRGNPRVSRTDVAALLVDAAESARDGAGRTLVAAAL
jgi:uncharacterized protein YbjT (DUF2867 family)